MVSTTLERPDKFRIGRVFNDSFAVISRNIGLYLGLALLFSGLPATVLRLWTESTLSGTALGDPTAVADPSMMFWNSSVGIAAGLVSFILSLLLQSALVRATIEDLNGKRPSFGDCIQIAIRYLLPTLGIGLLVVLGAGLASLALLVPGIILWLGWSVAIPVLIQERLGVLGSMSRSRVLTKGSRWALFGLFLILMIITMVIQSVMAAIVLLLDGIVADVAATMLSTVVSMVLSVATAVSYVELRQVKEGTSVDELAEIFS
ncbi:hypothetical protein [Mesorhizobium sp.]|uniref:hypothetical protein n=1 Tax=Mesorhizobium sp. TaxID=1871066 RepID=UPI000FE42DF0|nr:hypothetical protein [Mesorhizobium sp.]RWN56785.1 MAG: hypothetical protein EOS00_24460 [Mesorhizobium sp.]RWO34820.1 MAG: hypothetical protein EOS10_00530 [Mesorhizobium sp.]RWO37868.1 MAG: hypothetical protein EOS11_26570 [Mesorhizobium sp.]RWO89933.1 MAG: hypothetical protein EOQ95_16150 [Mesorhizobium sp.]RWQ51930.1 MAG: hypothetical protein EOS84_18700 [Mesorhizobium sp.]